MTKKKSGKRNKFLDVIAYLSFFFAGAAVLMITLAYFRLSAAIPDVKEMKNYSPSLITTIYDVTEEKIAEYYIEKRILRSLDEIPELMKLASLAIEDDNFYNHHGIDLWGIARAAIVNFKAGTIVQGGSTITQQVAKLLYLTRERTFKRKIKEVLLSLQIEKNLTKNEILEIYLNQIYYGHGCYGVEAASQLYFDKSVEELSLAEMAILAGLPKSPNAFSPFNDMEAAENRKNLVIVRMAELGYISAGEAMSAKYDFIELAEKKPQLNKAPFFAEHVRRYIENEYGTKNLYHNGLKIVTTLNLSWQKKAQEALERGIEITDRRLGYRGPVGRWNMDTGEIDPIKTGESTDSDTDTDSEEGTETETVWQGYTGWDSEKEFRDNPQLNWEKLNPQLVNMDENDWFKPGKRLRAIVKGVEKEYILIEINGYIRLIEQPGFKWAHPPNPEEDGYFAKRVTDATELNLNEGDVIEVRTIENEEDGTIAFFLDQEPTVQGAILSIDYKTGSILSMVGGYDYEKSSFNRTVQAKRQVGSSFKPIIYSAALNKGYTPATIVIDAPIIFEKDISDFKNWKPVNFNQKFFGPTTIRKAVTHSRNIVTIKVLDRIGIPYVIDWARKLGIESHLDDNLSLALGASSVTLQEMVSVFGVFANGGVRNEPYFINRIEAPDGTVIEEHAPNPKQVIPEDVAYLMNSIMRSVVTEGTATSVRSIGVPAGGKTGTTNDFLDAWFIGYTPGMVCGVWIGKDREETLGMNETGARAAAPIWLNYMKYMVNEAPKTPFIPPQNIVFVRIDSETGALATPDNPNAMFESFKEGQVPLEYIPPAPRS
ncbi:MAG: PBP1A family penicillin-binding protein [Nitrospinota bacterium]|nr:PBP1A family penicillin-binding protein [Nitrospinota bacterium]